MHRTALIWGITGQDGAYLAELLLGKGYEVHGASRDAASSALTNLRQLGIHERVHLTPADVKQFRDVVEVLTRVRPLEIYNLAGQSSVGRSFTLPAETFDSISVGTLNVLEAIRLIELPARLFNAGSGECFGDTSGQLANEDTPFRPRSPYGAAKAAAFWTLATYREAYAAHACTGVLFNHESPLRPESFVTRKVVAAACRIFRGSAERLRIGDVSVERDWGWAPEYVVAMWRILQHPDPQDFVIATGRTHALRDFVRLTFEQLGLEWEQHVTIDPSLFRPGEVRTVRADPGKAMRVLGWRAERTLEDVVRLMVQAELHRAQSQRPSRGPELNVGV